MSAESLTVFRSVALPSGERVPILGQGTWYMGEDPQRRREELAALRLGLDLGMTLIDTAEMYGNGAAEELVGEVIRGRREDVFIVTKVLPQHASERGTRSACEASLRRLGTDRIDLYLLHWREAIPLEETLKALTTLVSQGKVRYWGVSNFDVQDMGELVSLPGGDAVATNQVLYNLARRGIEWDLLPWCRQRGLPLMAYSPIDHGRLLQHPELHRVADRNDLTPAQVALAWVLRSNVIAIPRAATRQHVMENRAALDVVLTDEDMMVIDSAFPSPTAKRPLELL
jgi:diketogulonate reductase-like aldo/keto reductase